MSGAKCANPAEAAFTGDLGRSKGTWVSARASVWTEGFVQQSWAGGGDPPLL